MRKIAALSLALLLMASVGCSGETAKKAAIPADAKNLNFTMVDVNGATINMRENFGKVVIVDFWDTWCGPCRKGIPEFVELYNSYKDKGLVIAGVAFARQGTPAVKKFTDDMKISYISGIFNQETQALFGSPPSIPTTYIINQQGEIVEKVVGYHPKSYFEDKIKGLLKIS
ncbi:TlpA family protein disulfide reductase [candidate division KSB1 bacterium]|nr:TlpA family protein disulfide reductase [candidate division KSB1 bacterium]